MTLLFLALFLVVLCTPKFRPRDFVAGMIVALEVYGALWFLTH